MKGFTALIQKMLEYPNINVRCGEDALEHIAFDEAARRITYDGREVEMLIFTDNIDELFGVKHGRLPSRRKRASCRRR